MFRHSFFRCQGMRSLCVGRAVPWITTDGGGSLWLTGLLPVILVQPVDASSSPSRVRRLGRLTGR